MSTDQPTTEEQLRSAGPLGEAFADTMPEEETPNLPALLSEAGQLDADRLRELAPLLRVALIEQLRSAAADLRAGRGTVVTPEDTYDLVRRLTAAGESLRMVASAFEAAAKETAALSEEEALTAIGEQDGALLGSLFVPDGEGKRIAIKAEWKSGAASWDTGSLLGWVAEQTVADEGRKPEQEGAPVWTNEEAVSLCRDTLDRLLGLGSYSPSIAKIEALRKKLAGQQRDADAAILRQLRSVGDRTYQGVKVTREDG